MSYWIFTVTSHEVDGESFSAEEVYNQRMTDSFWGLGERTPNRRSLVEDDKVIFYIGIPRKVFGGTATLASPSFKLNDSQKKEYGHGKEYYQPDYGVLLRDIEIWKEPKSLQELIPFLEFIENKEFWGSYFQGGVRHINEADYRTILGDRKPVINNEEIESQAEFALENHLEEFIYENWGKIDWSARLELYKTNEQDGRQFPAGDWSIDFLAVDKSNNDLVVIELKRGRASDVVVGQLLRYIGWIKENVAGNAQKVKGIIIAKEVDDALKYAIKYLDHIDVKTYQVDFQLASFIK